MLSAFFYLFRSLDSLLFSRLDTTTTTTTTNILAFPLSAVSCIRMTRLEMGQRGRIHPPPPPSALKAHLFHRHTQPLMETNMPSFAQDFLSFLAFHLASLLDHHIFLPWLRFLSIDLEYVSFLFWVASSTIISSSASTALRVSQDAPTYPTPSRFSVSSSVSSPPFFTVFIKSTNHVSLPRLLSSSSTMSPFPF